MEAKTINKYKSKSVQQLRKIAKTHFNKFIRLRDTDENGYGNCISSGRSLTYGSENCQAGHFYSAGHYPVLEFNENNVHLQSKADNYFKSGNLVEYRKRLINKIGEDNLNNLDFIADQYKKIGYKHDRFNLIEIIETYKAKNKELIKEKNF